MTPVLVLVLALALAAASPPPAPAAGSPPAAGSRPASAPGRLTEVVDLGGARGYVRGDQSVPLAGIELVVRAGLDRETTSQNGLAALVAETILRGPVDAAGSGAARDAAGSGAAAVSLADAVDARGASISYAVGAQSVRFYLEGTPEGIAAAAPLVARAIGAPSYDAATLAAARTSLGDRIADEEDDGRLVGRAMLRSSYYRGGAGLPALGNATAIAAYGPADLQAFHDRWYLRGDAAVASVGHTGPASDAASRALIAALPDGTAPAVKLQTRPFGTQPKRIVTHRDVGVPYVVLGFAAPALGDRDFPAALVLRSLITSVVDRETATTLPAEFRSGGALYGYDAAPAQLVIWINGARIEPELGLATIDAVLRTASAKPLNAAVLSRFKDTARGQWALETVTLDERAGAIGNAVTLGLDADASDGVRAAIARVTAADVLRVAKKYFRKFDVALVIPRS